MAVLSFTAERKEFQPYQYVGTVGTGVRFRRVRMQFTSITTLPRPLGPKHFTHEYFLVPELQPASGTAIIMWITRVSFCASHTHALLADTGN